jgi:hypothetical protein
MKKSRLKIYVIIFFLALPIIAIQCAKKKPVVAETGTAAQTAPAKPGELGAGCGCGQAQDKPAQQAPAAEQGSTAAAGDKQGLVKVMVLLADGGQVGTEAVEKKIGELGGRVTAKSIPAGLYALIPPEKESELKKMKEIKVVCSKAVELSKTKGLSDRQKAMLKDWDQNMNNTRAPTLIPNPAPPPGDAKLRPETGEKNIDAHPPKEIPDNNK